MKPNLSKEEATTQFLSTLKKLIQEGKIESISLTINEPQDELLCQLANCLKISEISVIAKFVC